ncbi:MAG: PepSY domain-containing protein, partial [Clostridia bacterium]|nr:PepSY domain-containing protein [Clostridia bacterium]
MKKLFMLSSLVLILTLFTLPALSAEEQSSELTDMILQVKNQININVDDWKFESEYINNPQDSYWQLSWHDEDFNQYLSVSVQPVTKSITSAYYNASPEYGSIYSGYPAYNEEACLKTATQWVSETWPEAYAQATLQTGESQDPAIPSQRSYPYQYSFYFYRSQDGYPVSGNEINVVVNGETGKICEWSYNWKDNAVLPSAANMISLEQATNAFQKQSLFDLNYKLTNRYDPKAGQDLILTYIPKNSETFINALTGEVMDPNELFYAGHLAKGGYANAAKESVSNDERAIVLSPEEINEVDKLKQAISQEKAIQIANDFQTIPEGFQLTRASLTGNSDLVGVKATWYLYYENDNDYISYDINATTGEILNFYQHIGNANADNTKQISQQQAQQLAEDLIKQYNPERLEQLKLTDSHVNEADQYSPKTYTFIYERRVNDISYPDNHYNIIISASTGKLDSYSAQWEDLQFPQPANLIAVSQIEEQYL